MTVQRTIAAVFVLLLIGLAGTFCCVPSAHAQDFSDLFGDPGGIDDSADTETASLLDVLKNDSLLTKLQLNNDRRTKIKTIIEGYTKREEELQKSYDERKQSAGLRQRAELLRELRDKTAEARKQAEKSLSDLLSPAQIKSLAKELPAAERTADTVNTSEDKPAGRSAKSDRFNPTGKATDTPRNVGSSRNDSENAIASFAARADEKSGGLLASVKSADSDSSGQSTGSKNGASAAEPADTEPLTFNFENAPWTDVLKLFVGAAKLNLNIRDKPPGVFSYYDRHSYTPTEALDIMNRYLMQDGFILIRHDQFLTVLNVKNGIPPNLIETVSLAELLKRGQTELLRISLPLGDRDAKTTAEEIRAQLGPQGTVAPFESANSVVITDIASNLLRVQKLLEPPPKVPGKEQTFQAFPLTNIDAGEAAEIVRSLFGLKSGVENVSGGQTGSSTSRGRSSRGRFDLRQFFRARSGGGDSGGNRGRGGDSSRSSGSNQSESSSAKQVTVAFDVRTNSILVTATAAQMKLVTEIIEAIDVDSTSLERPFEVNRRSTEPYLEVYQLKTADATEVAKTLSVLHPGKVVNEDGRTKRIHIMATSEEHQEIATHVRQLDGEVGNELLVMIPLGGRSAFNTSTMLTSLFSANGGTAPTIQSDPTGRNLIVKGSASQIQQIRSLVEQLAAEGGPDDSRQAVRVIGVGSGSSAFVQQTISALYPQVTISSTETSSDQSANRSSRDSRSSRRRSSSRSSNDADAERAARIQRFREMRSRFFGGGAEGRPEFGRGGSSRSGGRRNSGSRSRGSRGSFSRGNR